jgi:penicillin amidase
MKDLAVRPWFLMLALCAAFAAALTLVTGYVRLRVAASRLPERGAAVEQAPGCPAPVEVIFDRRGFAHLRAHDERSLWFGQGYVHARDRFFQMEMARRLAAGRLAELVGPSAVGWDRKLRTWRVGATARRQLVRMESAERGALEAYTAGVNAALERYGRWIAPEIWMLGVQPEPWRPEDSLQIGVLIQLGMSWAMGEEVERAVQLGRLGRNVAVDLWGWSPREARSWIPPGTLDTAPVRSDEPIVPPVRIMGSNAWALARFRTSTNRPLLANDPHLAVLMPGVWYAVHLKSASLHLTGLSVPGAPGVLVGHNERVAWGMTNAMVDDQDLYVVTLDEAGTHELIDGNWQPLRTVTEQIQIRWQPDPMLVKIRLSERGPLVRESRREVLALSWTGLYGPTPLQAIIRMGRSKVAADVADAWQGVIGPALTLVAADVDGRIVRQTVGAVPRRGQGAGRLPAPAADSAWSWRGFVPLAERLEERDPADGFVVAANHNPFSEGDFPSSLEVPGEYDAPWRVRRIRHALSARHDWDVDRCLRLQGDVVSELALVALKQLWPDLNEHAGPSAQQLLSWDGRMDAGSVAAHLFARLMLELGSEVGGDEAGQALLGTSPIGGSELLRLLAGGLDEAWWDDVRSPQTEDRAAIVARVLDRLDRAGVDVPWGRVHRLEFSHPVTAVPVLGHFLGRSWNRGPFAAAGDSVTVNAHYWKIDRPFDVVAIPTARFVADVGNWDATVLVVPPGQSGRPWSSHYADQIEPWFALAEDSIPFSDAAVDAAAVARLILEPVVEEQD